MTRHFAAGWLILALALACDRHEGEHAHESEPGHSGEHRRASALASASARRSNAR
jgi:hypothetical protein